MAKKKEKKREWVLDSFKPLRIWGQPLGSKKSYNSQGETNSIVKVKVKPELHFCEQTDDDISAAWDYNWESPKLQSEVSLLGWTHHPGSFPSWSSRQLPLRTSQCCSSTDVLSHFSHVQLCATP